MGTLVKEAVLFGNRHTLEVQPMCRLFENNLKINGYEYNTALIYQDETTTAHVNYAALNARANRLARAIVAKAGEPNSDGDFIVAVCMKPSHITIETLLAVWKAGACYVPLEPSFPKPRVEHIISDSKPVLTIYDSSVDLSLFSTIETVTISYEDLLLDSSDKSESNLSDEEKLSDDDNPTALVLYTSGSTGIPKGVRLKSSAVCNRLWWQFRQFPFAVSESHCVWKTALTFVDAVCEIWGPLLHGLTLVVLGKEITRQPQKLVAALSEYQIQRLVLVPTLLSSLLMYLSLTPNEKPLRTLKLWICSGETLTRELAMRFFKYFSEGKGYKLANFYGSTEVMGDVTYHLIEEYKQIEVFHSVPIGTALDNCAIYVCDSELNVLPAGERGEVLASGLSLAEGYVNNKGNDKFIHNPHATKPEYSRLYRTGDFGVIENGVLLYAGRTDSQVKIRGNRVDLQEVEAAVNTLGDVDKGVVLCYNSESTNPELLAFVKLKDSARSTSSKLESNLKAKLLAYMIPQVIIIDEIPLLVNGKVDRQSLLKMYENTNNNDDATIEIDIDYAGIEQKDKRKAEVLFTLIGEVLGRSVRGTLSANANFYELGGNSLNSIYTITKLRDLGYYIDISDFLGAINLSEVISLMRTTPNDESEEVDSEDVFTSEPLADEHKDDVVDMVVTSFLEKADLEQWLLNEIKPEDYSVIIEETWAALLEANLSVILRLKKSNQVVAVALNFDARKEPEIAITGGLEKIFEFLESIEGPVRDNMLPKGEGTVLHSFMMATKSTLTASENVAAIRALEHATMKVAIDRKFHGVFTTNTSPLTQQLGRDVLGFRTLHTCQVNRYVSSGGMAPFKKAADDQVAIVCWKPTPSN